MKKPLLLFLLTMLSFGVYAQTVYTGALTNTDPTFNRPDPGTPPTSLSPVGTNTHYDVITFVVNTPGLITFTSTSVWDNFAVLYGPGGFDPANPLQNALLANDDLAIITFGFTYDFTVPGTYYLVVTSFKNGAIGTYSVTTSATTVVPLRLLSFTAEINNRNDALVKWSTADEVNISNYQVQHSLDGKSFRDIGATINARNLSSSASYSYTAASVSPGLHFYRLKILEKDGSSTLSNIAAINNKQIARGVVRIFPNPAAEYLKLETNSGTPGKAMISIVGMRGETVYSGKVDIGNAPLKIDVRRLTPGKYFVKTLIDNKETVVSFIKN